MYFGFDRREINPPTHQTGAVDYDGLPIASPAPKVALDKPGALAAGLAEADRIRPVVDQKTHKGIPTLPR